MDDFRALEARFGSAVEAQSSTERLDLWMKDLCLNKNTCRLVQFQVLKSNDKEGRWI